MIVPVSTSLEILIVSDLTIGVYGKIIRTGNLFSKGSTTIHTPSLPPPTPKFNTSINVINTHGKCAFFSSVQNNYNLRDLLMYLLENRPITYRVIFSQKLKSRIRPCNDSDDSSYTK